jgi:hypothetical protein
MTTQYWTGASSGVVSLAANWNASVAISNDDNLIFDSASEEDVTSGSITNKVNVSIGQGFSNRIGTKLSSITIGGGHVKGDAATIDMRRGFANVTFNSTSVVINNSPAGDSLYLGGTMSTVTVTGPTGNITFASDATITTLIIAPNRESGPDPLCQVTLLGGAVTKLVIAGPSIVDCSATVATAVCVGPGLRVDVRENFGTTQLVVVGCTVKQHEKTSVMGGSGGFFISRGVVMFAEGVETSTLATGESIDLYPASLLDLTNVQTLTSPGTITSYGGNIRVRKPVTMAIPSDTKLSSTSGRSLNFQLAANSGHVPTVLW